MSQRERALWAEFDRFVFRVVAITLVVLIVVYSLAATLRLPEGSPWDIPRALTMDISAHLAAIALAFVAAFILLRRFDTLRADFQNERLIRAISEATATRLQAMSAIPLASVQDSAHYYQKFADVPWDDLIKRKLHG